MNLVVKILYINFLTSDPDRSTKILKLYESCIGEVPTLEIYELAEKFYRNYHIGDKLVPIKPI